MRGCSAHTHCFLLTSNAVSTAPFPHPQRAAEGKCEARCVYVAPLESLVAAAAEEWRDKLGKGLGIEVAVLTGGGWMGGGKEGGWEREQAGLALPL